MRQMKMILKIAVLVAVSLTSSKAHSQQTRVDSAIALLNKSNTAKGVDTLLFNVANTLITNAVLSADQINQLEKASDQFKRGSDERRGYQVKSTILGNLSKSDKYRAIDYGRLTIENLEKINTPQSRETVLNFLINLRIPYRSSDKLPEGVQFITEKLSEYKSSNDSIGIRICHWILGGFYNTLGLNESAIYHIKKSISYYDTSDRRKPLPGFVFQGKIFRLNNTGVLIGMYLEMGLYDKAIEYGNILLRESFYYYSPTGGGDSTKGLNTLNNIIHLAHAKILSNQLDSVDYFLRIAESTLNRSTNKSSKSFMLQIRSLYDMKRGALQEADSLLRQCWQLVNQYQINENPGAGVVQPDYYLALLRIEQKKYNEAIALLLKDKIRVKPLREYVLKDYKLLAELYEKTGDNVKAKEYYKYFISLQDSILADQSKYRTISFETEQKINENEVSISKLENKNKLSALFRNFTIGIAALLLILAGSIYYRFQAKKKANRVLESTLSELKSTQSQLIQSEKMASLGELTAGIAHEIQNPLNFVNNFSEVNKELAIELEEEIDKGNYSDAKAIAKDIRDNEEKINHHGNRAADIVKGMLQHSRSSSGVKEPTDINALCDEYLRLSYHGLKAKDKNFNAKMITNYDESIGKINIIPQDIGRVVLNLINNAFYAAPSKGVLSDLPSAGGFLDSDNKHVLTVWVSTKKVGDKVFISVRDNGPGIPNKILDKIFQPFFTTKPTGQGTGLGLSLSYDIVKAHGGELKVETKEGEGSEFIIQLPMF